MRAKAAALAVLAAVGAPRPASAEPITFDVEVPHCTPGQVLLRSNRESVGTFRHDALTRVDATRWTGTFEVGSRAGFEYKYTHTICDATSCVGVEKDLPFAGTGYDVAPRTLPAGVTSTQDLVFIWRDALTEFDAGGAATGTRPVARKVAFCAPNLSVAGTDGTLAVGYDAFDGRAVALDYGPTNSYGTRLTQPAPAWRNFFTLPSTLVPGTTVHYRVVEDGVPGPDRQFVVPPRGGTGGALRFVQLGDLQTYVEEDRTRARGVVQQALAFQPHLVVGMGDLVASTTPSAGVWTKPEMGRFNVAFGIVAPLWASAPFVSAMGNHEEDVDYYWSAFDFPKPDAPKLDHYWLKVGNVHLTVLYTGVTDGYDQAGILGSQTAWLEQVLIAAGQDPEVRFKVVALHRGPFSQGASHPSDGTAFWWTEDAQGRSWGKLAQAHGVDLVLAGHNHNLTVATSAGIHYVTTCGGAPEHDLRTPWDATTRYAEKTCAANLFTARAKTLSMESKRPDGTVVAQASFTLCREAADCAELADPCTGGAQASWTCVDRECRHFCGAPVAADAGADAGAGPDAATPSDAAGSPDAEPIVEGPDAGAGRDSGRHLAADAGQAPPGEGCGCGVAGGPGPLLAIALAALLRRAAQRG